MMGRISVRNRHRIDPRIWWNRRGFILAVYNNNVAFRMVRE